MMPSDENMLLPTELPVKRRQPQAGGWAGEKQVGCDLPPLHSAEHAGLQSPSGSTAAPGNGPLNEYVTILLVRQFVSAVVQAA